VDKLNRTLRGWANYYHERGRTYSFATRPLRPEGPPDHERAGETFLHLLISKRRPRWESQLNNCFGRASASVILMNLSVSGCRHTAAHTRGSDGDPVFSIRSRCEPAAGCSRILHGRAFSGRAALRTRMKWCRHGGRFVSRGIMVRRLKFRAPPRMFISAVNIQPLKRRLPVRKKQAYRSLTHLRKSEEQIAG
jgi:hypothetical protein